jgi:hypothetical protein
VIADQFALLVPPQVRPELPSRMTLSAPFQEPRPLVVERPIKGAWWVNGHQEAVSAVWLAPPLGRAMRIGAKVAPERRGGGGHGPEGREDSPGRSLLPKPLARSG